MTAETILLIVYETHSLNLYKSYYEPYQIYG